MYRQLDLNSYQLEPAQCKRCGSYAIVRNGHYRGTRKQVYRCKRCNCRFVYNYSDLEKMRFHSKIIAFAVELYTTTGISLRTLARKMREYFGIGTSYEAIRLWVRKAAKHVCIPRLHKLNARFWCVDETMIKVNGKYIWLWVVFDPENKVVIAWHTSRVRTLNDAVTLLREAFRRTANVPWQIITDNLPHYRRAIAKVFYRGNRPEHFVAKTVKRNNYIERLFREVKRRTKWFSAFRAYSSVAEFFKVFFYCHNHCKYHESLHRTPLEQRTLQQAIKSLSLLT